MNKTTKKLHFEPKKKSKNSHARTKPRRYVRVAEAATMVTRKIYAEKVITLCDTNTYTVHILKTKFRGFAICVEYFTKGMNSSPTRATEKNGQM